MRLIIFTLGVFVHFSCFSQVSNDDCFNASPLGALPAPANCGNGPNNDGQGDPVTFTNLTNVGAQTENPYTTLINCQGSGQDMASPATDVWYSFVPTGLSLDITINGLINDPNVALWTGNCGTLIGAGCDIGSGGSLTTTIDQLNPGDTYYLQISGGDSNDEGTFDLTLQNNVDCNACLLSSTMIVDPLPLNGTYQPGTIVSFCFTVDEWNQTNTNWFQGVVPIMGSSWTNLTPISSPQTCDSGPGIWDWFNGVTTPLGNSNGFFFDGAIAGFNTIPDGDPTNNFGDNCQGTGLNWEFCWQATVEDCPPGQTGDDLTVNVETYGDGETGNWSDVGCNFDPVFLFSASLACCASPLVFSTNASCQGMNDGFVSTEAQTTANPWDFEWTDDSGNVISTTNNSNSATNVVLNLAEGTYTVTVTDANGCVSSGSIAITAPSIITPLFNQMANICNGDSFSLPNVSTNGINGSWLPTIDNTQTTTYTFSPDVGQCSTTADMTVTVNPQVTGTEAYTGCQGDGYSVDVNGVTYDEGNTTGVEVLMNSNGCDSTVTITLIYNNNTFGTETYTGCQGDGYSVDVNGVTYDEGNPSGTEVLTNSNGCDSTVTITLIYNNNTFGTETYTGCQGDGYSVVVNGVTYDEGNPSGTEVLTNSNSCDSTVTIDLIFNTLPTINLLGNDPSVCNASDGSIIISGLIPLTQYTLSYDSFGSSQSFSITTDSFGEYMISGLTAGLYSGFSISLNGCEGTSLDVIDLNNPGAPSIDLQSSITECDTYTLSDITGTNLSGDQGYYTQSNGGGIQLDPGDVITSTQTIYLYDVLGSCADESSFTVTIDNTPSIDNPGPQEVCGVYSLPLSIFGSNLSGNESFYNGLQSNGGTIIIDPILVSQTVYIYDENGACSNEVSFDVTVNELPALLGFTGEGTYCDGDVISNLFAEVSGTPEFTLEYTLDGVLHSINSSISSIDLGNTSGVYILTALNDNFCSVLINATQTITINSIPDMPIVSQDTIYCENSEPLDLQVSGGNGSYSWFSDASLSQPIGNSDSFTPSTSLGSTTYYVTTTENGCEGLPSTVTITFESCDIIIPTAFTPNDDSVNDTWELGSIDDIYPSNVVSIYNRWGSKVFESTSGTYNEKPWNGNYNGNKLPVGSYYFIIEFNDNYTLNKTGIVTIITD